jgi:putative selenate reductase
MAHLSPYPFDRLLTRVLHELEGDGPVLDLPRAKFVRGHRQQDWSARLHGRPVATPLGPAAGPHTQLAQNIALAFLGGCRVFELKTVQLMDELVIPRPCIDLRTVGFNVEWSQELKLEQSLEEYVKASMLLEVLVASGALRLEPGFERFAFDLSVGYDLKGIQHERVQAFLNGMHDASPIIDRLRAQIPSRWARFRDLDFRRCISDTLTLSTFHGCPPNEIEGITRYLMERHGLHCVVKLNPTLNGPAEARHLFHDVLGYRFRIPDAAFENDPTFAQAVELIGRLEETSRQTGKGLGVKFSNTLVVENEGDFLPKSEKLSYLSGQPLHVLAMTLVERFRGVFGDRLPVSFSAGIERHNVADTLSLGLVPVTVCSDLLRPGGYGRLSTYFHELGARLDAVGAKDLAVFTLKAQGAAEVALEQVPGLDEATKAACRAALSAGGDLQQAAGAHFDAWVSAARLENTRRYVAGLTANPKYLAANNAKPPKKVGTRLELFDCITCDKCVPVCPNHANFAYALPKAQLPIVKLSRGADGAWVARPQGTLTVDQKHQLANYADFCNECGNCDVFCPEDGGPYVLKPRFFGSEATWSREPRGDGFLLMADGTTRGRFNGREYALTSGGRFTGAGFELELDDASPDRPRGGRVDEGVEVDLTYFHILRWLGQAVRAMPLNYVNA